MADALAEEEIIPYRVLVQRAIKSANQARKMWARLECGSVPVYSSPGSLSRDGIKREIELEKITGEPVLWVQQYSVWDANVRGADSPLDGVYGLS